MFGCTVGIPKIDFAFVKSNFSINLASICFRFLTYNITLRISICVKPHISSFSEKQSQDTVFFRLHWLQSKTNRLLSVWVFEEKTIMLPKIDFYLKQGFVAFVLGWKFDTKLWNSSILLLKLSWLMQLTFFFRFEASKRVPKRSGFPEESTSAVLLRGSARSFFISCSPGSILIREHLFHLCYNFMQKTFFSLAIEVQFY